MNRTTAGEWRDLLETKKVWEVVLSYAIIPVVCGMLAWGLWALTEWWALLYWPVVILAGLLLFISISLVATELLMQVKRADTATQTLRAASQGRIEVIGTVRPIEAPLVSPLYGVPCVAFNAWFRGKDASGQLVEVREKTLPDAVVLTDGVTEAFLPIGAPHETAIRAALARLDAPHDWLRQDIREALGEDGTILIRTEEVIPCDKPLQVNGVFRTLSSRDSYRTIVNAHVDFPPPLPENLAKDAVELAWKAFCQRCEAAAGGKEVPVDAILPVTHIKGIGIVRVKDADWRYALDSIATTILIEAPFAYLFARLLDVVEPLPLLF